MREAVVWHAVVYRARSLVSVVGCRRQMWNVAMRSPEEVEPGGVMDDCARR